VCLWGQRLADQWAPERAARLTAKTDLLLAGQMAAQRVHTSDEKMAGWWDARMVAWMVTLFAERWVYWTVVSWVVLKVESSANELVVLMDTRLVVPMVLRLAAQKAEHSVPQKAACLACSLAAPLVRQSVLPMAAL